MLIHYRKIDEFALGKLTGSAPFPHRVKLDVDMMAEVVEWCRKQFGRPANEFVEEGFQGYHKIYQERSWLWSPVDRGYLYFDDPKNAVMAKLAWGGVEA